MLYKPSFIVVCSRWWNITPGPPTEGAEVTVREVTEVTVRIKHGGTEARGRTGWRLREVVRRPPAGVAADGRSAGTSPQCILSGFVPADLPSAAPRRARHDLAPRDLRSP